MNKTNFKFKIGKRWVSIAELGKTPRILEQMIQEGSPLNPLVSLSSKIDVFSVASCIPLGA